MMGIQGRRHFALLVLMSLSLLISSEETILRNRTSMAQDLKECKKAKKDISGALGSLLVIETIFCCYVLFSWARNSRFNLKRKERRSDDPEKDGSGFHMYTEADEGTKQDQNHPKNGQPLASSPQSGMALRPGHQHLPKKSRATEKIPGKRFIERLMARRHNKPNVAQNLDATVLPSNEHVIEEDVGGLVYSEPYEDKVSVATELKFKKPGSFRGKINKDPSPEKEIQLVYYHVLEESTEPNANLSTSPIEYLPGPSEEAREDVYYYCDSNNPENEKIEDSKTAPPKPLPLVASNNSELEDDTYYSCVAEESTNSPSQTNPKKVLLPLPQISKEMSSPRPTTSAGFAAAQQKTHFHGWDNQTRNQTAKPIDKSSLKGNLMINAHMIQEMKSRVANKKFGN
ncbi:uncharacterized protein LOC116297671 [Actinia tenebrosa]|uniref:Uncharacterized protein LOC116297671 n=1 Tax=Actinia tenebrosa TaxID=6105 RepID=A0A6P8IAR9_ACTTE|nr:uncharacterized protein LOC116297671 [Actinia tenebrosa]